MSRPIDDNRDAPGGRPIDDNRDGPGDRGAADDAADAPLDEAKLHAPLSSALAAMADDIDRSPPAIDWARLEARTFAAIEATATARPRARWSRGTVGFGVAATLLAAAAAAVVFAGPSTHVEPAPIAAPAVAAVTRRIDGGASTPVDVGASLLLAPSTDSGWVESSGRFSARVAARSRGRLSEDRARVVFALDEGEVAADVVPVIDGEPFAVDVGARRVAVHGTKLDVAWRDQTLVVAVATGVAVVGTPSSGRTEGTPIPAGFVGTFFRDGSASVVHDEARANLVVARGLAGGERSSEIATGRDVAAGDSAGASDDATHVANRPEPIDGVANAGHTEPSSVGRTPAAMSTALGGAPSVSVVGASAPSTSAPPPIPAGLSEEQAAPVMTSLASSTCACIHLGSDGATYSTRLTASIAPAGTLLDLQFDPPIDPRWRDCIRSASSKVTFTPAPGPSIQSRVATCSGK